MKNVVYATVLTVGSFFMVACGNNQSDAGVQSLEATCSDCSATNCSNDCDWLQCPEESNLFGACWQQTPPSCLGSRAIEF